VGLDPGAGRRRRGVYDKGGTVGVKIWTEISGERLAGNFAALERIAAEAVSGAVADSGSKPAAVLAVVKANAYGHGIDPCAAVLAKAGAEWLGVTDAHEGAAVRTALAEAGIADEGQPQVLVMCGTAGLPGEAETIVANRLTAVVWTGEHIERLAAASEAGLTRPVEVHLEIDSGMSRQGVPPGDLLERMLETIAAEPRLALTGVLTHFASTEVANSPQTETQQKNFEAAIAQVAARGMRPKWVHVGNSSYIDNSPAGKSPLGWLQSVAARVGARAMVRSGIALYGYLLPIAGHGRSLAAASVLPVMTWKTRVIALSEVKAGDAIGYNGTHIALRPMRVALLPVGYADGLRRELSSTNTEPGGWVMIRGARAPIVGRISMNLTTVDVTAVDVTAVSDVSTGDEVVLLGEGITADDHARLAGTIAYEILCAVRTGP
jgi:alanine racemase